MLPSHPSNTPDLKIEELEHVYKPLSYGQIRVLELLPGGETDTLQGRLSPVRLDSKIEYEAISYVWGSDDKTHLIRTTSGTIAITQSLHLALTTVRFEAKPRLVWADAVCINQADNIEKSGQVRLMYQIFSRASHVLAYLGEQHDDSQDIPDILHFINTITEEMSKKGLTLSDVVRSSGRDLRPLVAFLKRPWFARTWVVQECVAARRMSLICGSWEVSFEQLAHEYQVYYDCVLRIRLQCFIDEATVDILNQRLIELRMVHFIRTGNGRQLLGLLGLFQLKLATRSRDHLFGLLALANDSNDPIFDPDYEEPLEDIVRRYATGFLQQGQCHELLGLAGLSEHSLPDRFPSWIPDWTRQPPGMTVGVFSLQILDYAAAGTTKPVTTFDRTSDVLTIRGRSCGSLGTVVVSDIKSPDGVAVASRAKAYEDKALKQRYFTRCEEVVRGIRHIPDSQELSEVLWRTLITNDDEMRLDRISPAYTMACSYRSFRRRLAESVEESIALDAQVLDQTANVAEDESDSDCFDPLRFDSSRYAYESRFKDLARHYSFAVSDTGYACLVPNTSNEGDIIGVFYGCKVPFVIRKSTIRHDNVYQLIGRCYVHGIMNGEVLADKELMDEEIRLH